VNLYACFPFPDGDAKRHKDLSGFGLEKALRPAGGESLYYFAPKCLYRGEYKRGTEYGSSMYGCGVACVVYMMRADLLEVSVPAWSRAVLSW